MTVLAGFWGPEALTWSTSGTPVRDTPVEVLVAATGLPAVLYFDESKAVFAANPVKTDRRGNLSFYAVPGEYLLRWNGALTDLFVTVMVHPDDPSGGGGGVTDHGLLTGLADDDHAQYHNNARGDARYYTQGQLDASLAGKAATVHTHTASQITDFSTAVDARIQNVVGSAPAALDTLGELSDALGDDANFAATMTTSLAGKQPIDADLTAIAALSPADGSVLARVAGAWNSQTTAQLKTSLALTKADVGLSIADNTSDAAKPISTATQAALDLKAKGISVVDPMTKYGLLASTGRFDSYQDVGGFSNQWMVVRMFVPANAGAMTRMAIPVRNASTAYASNGKPNHLAWWNDAGVLQSATPDDSTMWSTADWYVATLASPVPNFTVDTYVYGGYQINGQTGGSQFVLSRAVDNGGIPFSHAPGSTKRFCAYQASVASLTNFDPNSFGTMTSFAAFFGFLT